MKEINNKPELILSKIIRANLLEIARWTKVLSILGFVIIGLLVVIGLFATSIPSRLALIPNNHERIGGFIVINRNFFGLIYVLIAFISFFPVKYLYLFSIKLKNSIINKDQLLFTRAFIKLKKNYRYIAIVTLIIVILYLLITLFDYIFMNFPK